jgi:hypothetical protein
MKGSDQICADIELRLVDGRPVADDPEAAAHLRSCLRCFRAATELRQVPQLAALLREAELDAQPDPGELFWARFPRTVADAWERRQQVAAVARAPAWKRVTGWLRMPIPAALSGAAVAAALVLVVVHRSPIPHPRLPVAAPPAPPAAVADVSSDEESPALLGEDDPLDSLELADARLVARVGGAEPPSTEEPSELSPSPAEELELLDTEDLRAVAQALHGRSRI